MIITNRPPRRKRPAKSEQAIEGPRVVQTTPKGRGWKLPLQPDPEADARVRAFFERMGLKLPDRPP